MVEFLAGFAILHVQGAETPIFGHFSGKSTSSLGLEGPKMLPTENWPPSDTTHALTRGSSESPVLATCTTRYTHNLEVKDGIVNATLASYATCLITTSAYPTNLLMSAAKSASSAQLVPCQPIRKCHVPSIQVNTLSQLLDVSYHISIVPGQHHII